MKFLRSTVLGIMFLIVGCIIGIFFWYLLGGSYDNGSPQVYIPCNIIPLISLLFGIIYSLRNPKDEG